MQGVDVGTVPRNSQTVGTVGGSIRMLCDGRLEDGEKFCFLLNLVFDEFSSNEVHFDRYFDPAFPLSSREACAARCIVLVEEELRRRGV
jgi:hypothetical protein